MNHSGEKKRVAGSARATLPLTREEGTHMYSTRTTYVQLFCCMIAFFAVLFSGVLGAADARSAAPFGDFSDYGDFDNDAKSSKNEDTVGQGTLQVIAKGKEPVEKEESILVFPLKHTDVDTEISGFISRVTVTQTFENPFDETIEAVYVFPLPEDGAVFDMTMKIGERTIKGVIKKREEARQIYEQAIAAGKTASLLEQERPNIFTQTVGNILPGDTILIEISYVDVLKYDDGWYTYVFPMVVGPRFNPPGSTGGIGAVQRGDAGESGQTTEVQYLRKKERSGHDINVTVDLNAGVPIRDIESASHRFDFIPGSYSVGSTRAAIQLQRQDRIPNKDFILKYRVTGEKPEAAVLTHRGKQGGFFMMMVQPKADIRGAEITPKEMIFVLDCSGSMSGAPMEQSKELVRHTLREINPDDTFQIIRFSEHASGLARLPLKNTPENIKKGLNYINTLHGTGGTMMIEGIKAALDFPEDPKRLRIVCFLTDGYIGNENQIFAALRDKIGSARLFSFGVGSSVNRYLLERMAEEGRGLSEFVRPDEEPVKAVSKFYERIRNPYFVDIAVDWDGLDVDDIYPRKIPDMFSSHPVFLFGRYGRSGFGTVTVSGRIAGKNYGLKIPVDLPASEEQNASLASIWARTRVKDLMSSMHHGEREETVEQVTDLCLEFKLMSKYTSFVAVEEKVRTDPDGNPIKVMVPVEMPEHVSHDGVFGEEDDEYGFGASLGAPTGMAQMSLSPRIKSLTESAPREPRRIRKPVPEPVVPEIEVKYLGYTKKNGKPSATIEFEKKTFEVTENFDLRGAFKVMGIKPDKLEIYSYRTRRRKTFKLEKGSWFGIKVSEVDTGTRARHGLAANEGLLITGVASGGPADDAGIEPGDIITSITGPDGQKTVISKPADLPEMLKDVSSGARFLVIVIHNGFRQARPLTVTEQPDTISSGTWY